MTSNIFFMIFTISSLFIVRSAIVRTTVPAGCTWQGKTYPEGQRFSPDPCTFCTCNGGRPMCAVVDCAMPACVDMVHDPDQCCPTCPNGPNCRAPDGSVISAGQTVNISSTTTCTCPGGHSGFFMNNLDALCKHVVH